MEEGNISDFELQKAVWEYLLKKLNVGGSTKVLLTETPFCSKQNKERIAELFFEEFGFKSLKFSVQALLALFSEDRMSGLVIDSGDGVTHAVPVHEGFVDKLNMNRINVAGRHVTDYLAKLLLIKGYLFSTSSEVETVREIKEKCGYVSCNIELDRRLARETTFLETEYQLPDGRFISLGRERFEATEGLFYPQLMGKEDDGIVDLIVKTIQVSPMDNKKSLLQNILISGGTSMFPGMPDRIKA